MDDLRDTAYAYYEHFNHETQKSIQTFSEQMETKSLPNKIKFREFSAYMKDIGFPQFGSKNFFDQLKRGKKDHLIYADVITLLYIIESGRPFCNGLDCKNKFIVGLYFTCVECFFKNDCNYIFNVCPDCFRTKSYDHSHEVFLDPIVMLRLKTKLDKSKGVNDDTFYSDDDKGSGSKRRRSSFRSSASTSGTIVPHTQPPKNKKVDRALQIMQIAVSLGNLVAATTAMCSIM
ncbi:uncharacterized protein LOC115722665 [Cannabis sativa]|uniref:uncharacterized protein LOC115722665 n=1 Tax=Cannabis sativa TaxID=3483 RepID=UPI0029CA6747|nr:uncharacterized protein LOC115722665 [Cannabis sativa]